MLGPRQDLFTKASLEKLSSPEQLDVLMEVTKPMGWIGLGTTGFLLFMGVLWGIFGSIPIRVDGKGILTSGPLLNVTAGTTGEIKEVLVTPGQVLAVNDPVATVGQGKLTEEIANAKADLADSESKFDADTANEKETLRTTMLALDQEEKNLQDQLRTIPQRIQGLATIANNKRLAFQSQVGTRQDVIRAEADLQNAKDEQGRLQASLQGIPAKRSQAEQTSKAALSARENEVLAAKRRIKTLEGQLKSSTTIVSRHAGRVVEMTATLGTLVTPGTSVANLEPLDTKLIAYLYIPSGEGKRASREMEVRLSPSTVKPEEYGFMKGVVRTVSSYPATPQGIMLTLRNEALVKELTGGTAPLEVVVDLIKADNETGYQWSSPQGPPIGIVGGTMCTGSVIIDRRRPISYVIPLVKGKVGL